MGTDLHRHKSVSVNAETANFKTEVHTHGEGPTRGGVASL